MPSIHETLGPLVRDGGIHSTRSSFLREAKNPDAVALMESDDVRRGLQRCRALERIEPANLFLALLGTVSGTRRRQGLLQPFLMSMAGTHTLKAYLRRVSMKTFAHFVVITSSTARANSSMEKPIILTRSLW